MHASLFLCLNDWRAVTASSIMQRSHFHVVARMQSRSHGDWWSSVHIARTKLNWTGPRCPCSWRHLRFSLRMKQYELHLYRKWKIEKQTEDVELLLCSLRCPPSALDSDVYWPAQDLEQTTNGSPITRTVGRFIQAPAQNPLVCCSTRRCWLQPWVSCAIVRHCCDCTASSAPTTSVHTRLDSTRLANNASLRWRRNDMPRLFPPLPTSSMRFPISVLRGGSK